MCLHTLEQNVSELHWCCVSLAEARGTLRVGASAGLRREKSRGGSWVQNESGPNASSYHVSVVPKKSRVNLVFSPQSISDLQLKAEFYKRPPQKIRELIKGANTKELMSYMHVKPASITNRLHIPPYIGLPLVWNYSVWCLLQCFY